MPKCKMWGLSLFIGFGKGAEMKYLFAGLIVSTVQMLFLVAFTIFALGIGVVALLGKLKPGKISD